MKIKLISDFTDYFDHWFSLDLGVDDEVVHRFRRVSTGGMNRLDCLLFLEKHGYKVPPFGEVVSLLSRPRDEVEGEVKFRKASDACTHLVVYTDQRLHCGDGKILVTKEEAVRDYPGHLAMEYIPEPKGLSWRYLQVGYERFWIEYWSDDDWRSNRGDEIDSKVFCREEPLLHPTITYPLFAIDFVPGKEFWAVDFNIAPGIRGSGVERMLPPKMAHETLAKAYQALMPWLGDCIW